MIRITHHKKSTPEANKLRESLEQRGIEVISENFDGYKHVDLTIPQAKLDIEVDGIKHFIDPKQINADLNLGYHSHRAGYNTMHIPNEMIHLHLSKIADTLAEVIKIRKRKIHIHLD